MTKNDVALIAALCHEANRAYCASIRDDSQPLWGDAPEWQRESAIKGVEMHLANPNAGARDSHESWFAQKQAEGWSYGPVKDVPNKRHPCYVPFEELPAEQQTKDHIFRSVVHAAKAVLI